MLTRLGESGIMGGGGPPWMAGRKRNKDLARAFDATLAEAVGEVPAVIPAVVGRSTFASPAAVKTLCLLKFRGATHRMIAEKLGCSHTAVNNFVSSSHFAAIWEEEKARIWAQVDEFSRDRLQEVLLEVIEFKVEEMRGRMGRRMVPMRLRDKAASDLYEWSKEAIKSGRAGFGEVLRRTYEKAVARKLGTAKAAELLQTRGPQAGEGAVGDARGVEGGGEVPALGGEGAGALGWGGEVGGGAGVDEAASVAGASGSDGADGGGGVLDGSAAPSGGGEGPAGGVP